MMHLFPFGGECVEVLVGGLKNFANLRTLNASPDCILAISEVNGTVSPEIGDRRSPLPN
jgi:hypothetical protein